MGAPPLMSILAMEINMEARPGLNQRTPTINHLGISSPGLDILPIALFSIQT